MMRYFVTKPVPGGYAFWDVRTDAGPYPNFSLASFSKWVPLAGLRAYAVKWTLTLLAFLAPGLNPAPRE